MTPELAKKVMERAAKLQRAGKHADPVAIEREIKREEAEATEHPRKRRTP